MSSIHLQMNPVESLPPVQNKPLATNVSASQVKLYDRCARLWWLNYVAGVREKRLQHFILGTALHSVGERFLLGHAKTEADLYPPDWNKGLTEDESVWINRATRHAIETGVWQLLTDSYVEFPLLFLTGAHHVDARGLPLLAAAKTYDDEQGVRRHTHPDTLIDGRPMPADWNATPPFVGFIDLLKLGREPAIIDHKTSKTRRYATTAKKLAEDAQVLSYAALPMVLDPTVENVRLRHNIFLKSEDAKIAYAVDADAPLQRVLEQWEHNRAVVTEMVSLRTHFPKFQSASPFNRAKNWIKVRSAIDEGRPDACNDYGGCPFREACSGRCSVESVVQRLDAPPPPGFAQVDDSARKARTFGLNLDIVGKSKTAPLPPPPPPKDTTMFATPKLNVGTDVYVLDPSNAGQQYRCRIIAGPDQQSLITIALWPDADVMPAFESLGAIYRTDVPASALLSVPSIGATITGYAVELAKHPGVTGDIVAWSPAAPPSPLAAAGAAKVAGREPADGRFGLVGVGGAAVVTGPAAPMIGAPSAANPAVFSPASTLNTSVPPLTSPVNVPEGTILRVAATDHPFWSKLKGKLAKVAFSLPGDVPGTILYTVEIDGHPHPDVLSTRFEVAPVSLPAESLAYSATESLPQRCMGMVGRDVSAQFTVGTSETVTTINARLESAGQLEGITLLSGSLVIPYSNIVRIELMTESAIPGVTLPKGPGKVLGKLDADTAKAQAKHEKEQAKLAKVAGKGVPAPPESLSVEFAAAEGSTDLGTALDLVIATLNGGKVSRKVLETIKPLLEKAKAFQATLESIAATREHDAHNIKAQDSGFGPEAEALMAETKAQFVAVSEQLCTLIADLPG